MFDLAKVHRTVWDFREEMEHLWPSPGLVDSLRYAFTEAGEAMDARLRETRPGDSRNNDRQASVEEELADCAIMLLTALGKDLPAYYREYSMDGQYKLDGICLDVASALEHCAKADILLALHAIASYVPELEREIDERLGHIRSRLS